MCYVSLIDIHLTTSYFSNAEDEEGKEQEDNLEEDGDFEEQDTINVSEEENPGSTKHLSWL